MTSTSSSEGVHMDICIVVALDICGVCATTTDTGLLLTSTYTELIGVHGICTSVWEYDQAFSELTALIVSAVTSVVSY